MKHCLSVLKKHKFLIGFYILLGVGIAFLSAWQSAYTQTVLDAFTGGSLTLTNLVLYSAAMVAVYLLNYLDNWPQTRLENSIYLSFKLLSMEKLGRIDYTAYQTLGTGQLLQQVENGAQAGKEMLFSFFFTVLRSTLPSIAFSLWYIYRLAPALMTAILIGYGLVFLVSNLLLRALYRVKEKILDNEERFNRLLVRGFMELAVFRVNRRFGRELAASEAAAGEIVSSRTKMTLIHEAFFTIFALFVAMIKIGMLVYAWRTRAISVGAVVALLTLIEGAYQPIAVFNVLFVKYKLAKQAFGRLTKLLDAPEEPRLSGGKTFVPGEGQLEYRGAAFSYGERPALRGLNACLTPGTRAAFVGESGSGKTTALRLAAGLLRCTEGSVLADGQDLGETALEGYFGQVAYLSQEPPVFEGTLRENILFDRQVPDGEVLAALGEMELTSLVEGLPRGLDTPIGEKGATLSGGQRQRLALTRLYFTDAKIILLDEATSALDNLTEEKVVSRLTARLAGRTLLWVAHRLSSLQSLDRLYVFREGGVLAEGDYDTLLRDCPYFRELALRESPAEAMPGD